MSDSVVSWGYDPEDTFGALQSHTCLLSSQILLLSKEKSRGYYSNITQQLDTVVFKFQCDYSFVANGGNILVNSIDTILPFVPVTDHCAEAFRDFCSSVIAFLKVSTLFAAYNNNITLLLQLPLRPSIITTHENVYKYDYSNCCHKTDVDVL